MVSSRSSYTKRKCSCHQRTTLLNTGRYGYSHSRERSHTTTDKDDLLLLARSKEREESGRHSDGADDVDIMSLGDRGEVGAVR